MMSKEQFLTLDGLIIPNSQLDVKSFFSSSFPFSVKANETWLVTYPILYEPIIPNRGLFVKRFLSSASFFKANEIG